MFIGPSLIHRLLAQYYCSIDDRPSNVIGLLIHHFSVYVCVCVCVFVCVHDF